MHYKQKSTEVLYDLLQIHKDCSTECMKMMDCNPVQSDEFRTAKQLSQEGDGCFYELRLYSDTVPGGPAEAMTFHGEIYLSWQSMISSGMPACCEKYLKAIRKCYVKALTNGNYLSTEINQLLMEQVKRFTDILARVRKSKFEFVS